MVTHKPIGPDEALEYNRKIRELLKDLSYAEKMSILTASLTSCIRVKNHNDMVKNLYDLEELKDGLDFIFKFSVSSGVYK